MHTHSFAPLFVPLRVYHIVSHRSNKIADMLREEGASEGKAKASVQRIKGIDDLRKEAEMKLMKVSVCRPLRVCLRC